MYIKKVVNTLSIVGLPIKNNGDIYNNLEVLAENKKSTSILHISVYPEKGKIYTKKSGVASYLKNLLTSKKVEVAMTVLCDIDEHKDIYIEENLKIIRGWKSGLGAILDIWKFLRHSPHDVVHIQHELHFWGSMIVGYIVLLSPLLFRNKKWVLTSHHAVDIESIDSDFVRNHGHIFPVFVVKAGFYAMYFFFRLRDTVIVHEPVHLKRLSLQYGLKQENITVIPHGVESFEVTDAAIAKETLSISQNTKVIFTMGYVTGYKDLGVLITGYAKWLEHNPDSILIIGSGPEKKSLNNPVYMSYYQSLQDLAKKLIPKENYRWLGFVASDDIPLYYGASDVVVLPYRYTLSASGPMAIAIAYEIPFLASRCFEEYFPVFQECIFDMSTDGLAKSLDKFFADQQLHISFVKTLKQERQYSICLEKILRIYEY